MSRRLPSPSVGLGNVWRQLVSQPAVLTTVSLIVLVATLGLAALPRSLELASRDDLHQTLTEALPARRNLAISHQHLHRPGPDTDPLAQLRDHGRRFIDRELSDRLRGLVLSQDMLLQSPQFAVGSLPGEPARQGEAVFLDFRTQDAASDLAQVIEGRPPAPADSATVQFDCPPEEPECPPVEVPVFEIALTEKMSVDTRLAVGDRVLIVPDRSDTTWEGLTIQELDAIRIVVEVTGLVDLGDPDDERWFGDRTLHLPRRVFLDLDTQWVEGTSLISPDAYGDFIAALGGSGPPWWRYEWRYFIDPEGVARSDLGETSAEVARLRLANSASPPGSGAFVLSTRLPELIDVHLAQRTQTLRVMALTVAGMAATVTLAVLALGVLMTERQRDQIILTRDRGASAAQVMLSRLYQAVVLVGPPVVAAYLAAAAVFPDTSGQTSSAIAAFLALTALAAVVVPAVGPARLPLGSLRSDASWPPKPNPRRTVVELALVILAVACVVLVRRRDPDTVPGFDWLLVATPAVVGAAVGAMAIRVVGPVSSALAWMASRGRGAVSFLALRRSIQHPVRTRTPLAVLVVCMATASFSVVILQSIQHGQVNSSWRTVGADYSVSNPGASRFGELPGAEGLVYVGRSVAGATVNNLRSQATLVAVDTEAHGEVFAGTPADADLGVLRATAGSGALPGIVSEAWSGRTSPHRGQIITLTVGREQTLVEIVEIRAQHPGVEPPFVVVDLDLLEESLGVPTQITEALVRGPRTLGAKLTEATEGTGATVASRYEQLDRLAEDPMVRWTVQGLTAGWLMAAGVGALSIVAALALESARRRRDLGYLKTMGLETGSATAITLIEQVPGVALATALGLVTGAATVVAIRPSLDLGVLTGELFTPIAVDWGLLGSVFAFALLLLAASGVIFVLVNRRQDLGRAVRVGDE